MSPRPNPTSEARRIEVLRHYVVLDTPPEPALDDMTMLAAEICQTPMALISLVDQERQWFKSRVGFEKTEMPRDLSFCAHALHHNDLLLVPDATLDPRFAQNPLVTGEPHIRFYAGAPLVAPEGPVLGTLCVLDDVPRMLSLAQQQTLRVMARQVMTHLELSISHQRFGIVCRATNDAIWDWNLSNQVVWWNRGYETLFGYTPEETDPTVESWIKHLHPDDKDRVLKGMHKALADRSTVWSDEYRFRRKNATYADIFDRGYILRDGNHTAIRMIGAMQDVSDRKQSEIASSRLAAIIESSDDAIIGKNLNGVITSWNRGAERIFGYTAREMVGTTILRLIPDDRHEEEQQILSLIRRGEQFRQVETLRRAKDGRLLHVSITASPIKDAAGNVVGASKIARDITDRKQGEDRMRRLVESNAQGIVFWHNSGAITDANDAYLKIVGYSRQDLQAGLLNWSAMTPSEYARLDLNSLHELATQGMSPAYEKEYIRKDGTRVPVLIGSAAFQDNPNEGVAFVVDLTERKKLEQQFLRAQRMEGIGTLAGGIAHDLNNVLAPIVMSIDLLKMRFTDEKSQELLSTISSSAQRGADMVRQVLSFARGVEGRKMDVQIKHLIKDIEKITNETFFKHITVKTDIPQDPWPLVGDPTQLHQVLLNLCVNARDAMPNRGTLTLSAENIHLDTHYVGLNPQAHVGPYVLLKIEDTGIGIPPEVIEKIFDPFFTTKELGKGTGLGLSTSLAIVKSHGGFIQVYSEVDKGTKFKIYLPAKSEGSAPDWCESIAELPRGAQELILVVDDEASVRHITKQTLEAFGYRVLLASDGADAIAVYAENRREIAVVLTDMMMPVMDGATTIQALRRMNPKLPIIAASGLAATHHVSQASSLGVKNFLSKPYTADTLLKALKMALSLGDQKG